MKKINNKQYITIMVGILLLGGAGIAHNLDQVNENEKLATKLIAEATETQQPIWAQEDFTQAWLLAQKNGGVWPIDTNIDGLGLTHFLVKYQSSKVGFWPNGNPFLLVRNEDGSKKIAHWTYNPNQYNSIAIAKPEYLTLLEQKDRDLDAWLASDASTKVRNEMYQTYYKKWSKYFDIQEGIAPEAVEVVEVVKEVEVVEDKAPVRTIEDIESDIAKIKADWKVYAKSLTKWDENAFQAKQDKIAALVSEWTSLSPQGDEAPSGLSGTTDPTQGEYFPIIGDK